MSTCQDNHICHELCECTCDTCQDFYEAEWDKKVAERNLCRDCGMPAEMTVERLKEEHTLHFFQPCDTCRPAFLALMKLHKMCPTCQQYMNGYICKDCFCTEQPYTCDCRQCVAFRKNEGSKQNGSASESN